MSLRTKFQTPPLHHSRHRTAQALACLLFSGFLALSFSAGAQTIPPLGGAQGFSVLGGSTVTNTGPTVVTGQLGVSPGTAITGFPPGAVIGGTIHSNDGVAALAHTDASTVFTQLGLELATVNLTGQNLGGLTLTPGIYRFDTTAQLTGTLSLNTQNDVNAVFHFLIGDALTTASNSSVLVLNGGSNNIFWQIGSSATLGTGSSFAGTIIADQSITLNTGANLAGRALAINGAVTLDTNVVTVPPFLIGPPPPPPFAGTGSVWNGGASNLWSGVNWSPNLSGATTSTLAPAADVIFSVTGIVPQNQNTILDANATISSLTVNDPVPVTISGPGLLSIDGSGATTGITINAGAGLTTIDSNVALLGTAEPITVQNAAGLLVNGVISGATGLTKAGVGQLTLTGANTYTGGTTVLGGVLEVDGSIAGDALVSGGLLGGTGTIAGNVINNALVNPGRAGAPGALHIGGNFTQNPAGMLSIRLGSPSSFDSLTIGGAAVLSGALNVSYLGGFNAQPGDSFQILSAAGGVSGRFSIFDDAHATGTLLSLQIVYLKNAVLLEFVQGSFAGVLPVEASPNVVAVARALDRLAARKPGAALIRQLDLLQLSALPGAIALLSPEDFAAIFTTGFAVSQV